MLDMRGLSPVERLRKTLLSEIPLRQVHWLENINTKVENVYNKLRDEPDRWFIPITKEDGTLLTVLENEAIYLYVLDKKDMIGTLDDVLKYLMENEKLQKHTEDIYVEVKFDNNACYAQDLMQYKNVKLGIVTNEKGEPTHYVTTDDLRRLLMREST